MALVVLVGPWSRALWSRIQVDNEYWNVINVKAVQVQGWEFIDLFTVISSAPRILATEGTGCFFFFSLVRPFSLSSLGKVAALVLVPAACRHVQGLPRAV